jgi:predicted phosphodiesterase
VAATLARYHRERPFDFGITIGDNYQDFGPDSWTDERWQKYWQRFYPALGIPFYAILGNHDWFSPDGPAAEILYSQKDPLWKLPAPYYTFTAGPVQFFAVNTPFMTEGRAQLMWLRKELQKSTARWKIVYGHYHIYSALGDNKELIEHLLPILKENHVDVYLCGHLHIFQHLQPEGGVHYFVNGSAGFEGRKPDPYDRPGFVDYEQRSGFTVLEGNQTSLKVAFVDQDGKQFYEYTLRK